MIKVKDLPDQIGTKGPRAILYCPCGTEASAHRGDYFNANPETALICDCGEPLRLVIKETRYREVKPSRPDPTRYADHVKNGAGWKERK